MKKLLLALMFLATSLCAQTIQTVHIAPPLGTNPLCVGVPSLQYNIDNGHIYVCIINTGWQEFNTAAGSAPSIGGAITGGTANSILFVSPAGIFAQNNTQINWDNLNFCLNLGLTATGCTASGISGTTLTISKPYGAMAIVSTLTGNNAEFYLHGAGAPNTWVFSSQTGGSFNFYDSTNQTNALSFEANVPNFLLWGHQNGVITIGSSLADLGLYRASARTLELNNGTPGSYADLNLRSLTTSGGTFNSSASTHTLPTVVVASAGSLPVSGCLPGELGMVTGATLGQQLYENSGTGTCVWTQQTGSGGGGSISIGTPVGSGTSGSILYLSSGILLAQDNSNLFYDPTNKCLAIGIGACSADKLRLVTSSGNPAYMTMFATGPDQAAFNLWTNSISRMQVGAQGNGDLFFYNSGYARNFLDAYASNGAVAINGVGGDVYIGGTSASAPFAYNASNSTLIANNVLLAASAIDLGSVLKPFQNLYVVGAGTYGTNYFKVTGTPTGTRILTLPDATDTLVGKATPDTLTNKSISGGQISSTVALATALAANPADCSANQFANAIIATGDLTCAAPFTLTTTGTSGAATFSAGTLNIPAYTAGSGVSLFTGSTATNPSFSATPTFSLADVSVKSPARVEPGALTANVTSVTFSNKTAGAKFSIAWTQDGTGGRTIAYGASASNTCTIDPTASTTTTQFFEVAADGTTVQGVGCYGSASVFRGPETAAPGTPAASTGVAWWDSTNHIFSGKNNNNSTVSNMVVPQTCTAPQVLTALAATGLLTCAYVPLTQNSQSAAYTTVLGDAGKHILHPAADTTARVFTIDSNANVAYVTGTCISFINETAAGTLTIAITSDTMTLMGSGTTGSRTLTGSNVATACKIASTKWIISGSAGLT